MAPNVIEFAIDDLDKDEIENLQAMVVTKKSILTKLIVADTKPQEELLNKRLEVLINTGPSFPTLSQIKIYESCQPALIQC